MELETASGLASQSVTEAELIHAFQEDAGRGDFIILSQSDQVYIQASGEGDGPYAMEYREGDADHHFQGTQDLSKTGVQSAFLTYLRRDPSWKTEYQWGQFTENKPWWRFWK
jgi:hypothetical protein